MIWICAQSYELFIGKKGVHDGHILADIFVFIVKF
jgi:hypothetical protein